MMQHIQNLETPAILVRQDILTQNMQKYQSECDKYGKKLWPMVKTHKASAFCKMQQEIGADGFLCGTLDECEALCEKGFQNIMYAYPAAGTVSCSRIAKLASKCNFYVRLDSIESAGMLDEAAARFNANTAAADGTGSSDVSAPVTISYTLIIDCGLHRFGIAPENAAVFADQLKQFEHLRFAGISTHSGHVYGEADPDKIALYAQDEQNALHTAAAVLEKAGYEIKLVTTGATPTFRYAVADPCINIYHPGNYVFHDAIQIGNRTATEEECALSVYATVIAHPAGDLFICDAGAKCLGLDQGAHGNASVKGYGYVIGHPELTVCGLSEEVGKLHVDGITDLKIGDRIHIIPNHACSSANLTDYYIMVNEQDQVTEWIPVDIRGNKTRKI